MAQRDGTKQKDDFDSQFADLATFYDSSSKRRKLVKSSNKAGRSQRQYSSPRKLSRRPRVLPELPLVRDVSVRYPVIRASPASQALDVNDNKEGDVNLMVSVKSEVKEEMLSQGSEPRLELSESDRLQQAMAATQGEAGVKLEPLEENVILRRDLEEQSKWFQEEKNKLKDSELKLRDMLEIEKKKQDLQEERADSEQLFLIQELQGLQEVFKKKEKQIRRTTEAPVRGSESPGKLGASAKHPEVLERTGIPESVPEVSVPAPRRLLLGENGCKAVVAVRRFLLTSSEFPLDLRCLLLQANSESDLRLAVSSCVLTLTSAGDLASLTSLTGNLQFLMSVEELNLINQTCTRALERLTDCTSLQPVLSLVVTAWTPHLPSQTLTSKISSQLYHLISLRSSLPSSLSPSLVRTVFSVMSLISCNSLHCAALCWGGGEEGDCPLHLVSFITYYCLHSTEAEEMACSGLTSWLLASQRVSPGPPWTDNTCRRCTNDVIRNLVQLLESQVRRVVVHQHGLHLVRDVLERGVVVMKRYQDQLGANTWLSQFDLAASTQRKYFWLVEKLSLMSLDSRIMNKLNYLKDEMFETS